MSAEKSAFPSVESAPSACSDPSKGSSKSLWILGKRRSFLVPDSGQKRSIVAIVGGAALLIAGIDAAAWWALRIDTARESAAFPELAKLFAVQDRAEFLSIAAASFVGLMAIAAIAVFETHRVAGPLFNLRRAMHRMREVGPSVRVYFRASDRFQDLQEEFNEMAESMESRFIAIDEESSRLADAIRSEAAHLAQQRGASDESAARLSFIADEVDDLLARSRRAAGVASESRWNSDGIGGVDSDRMPVRAENRAASALTNVS